MGGGPCRLGGLLFYIGEIKNVAFFQTRKFSKNVKKSMKILEFFENLNLNFAIFWKFFKILSKISRKFRENFRKFWKYGFEGGSGGGDPEANENITKLVEKSMENGKILKLFMKF